MILSIFGKPLEILKNEKDEMKVIVKCPNCGKSASYGKLRMCSGLIGCDNYITINGKNKECYFGDLLPRVLEAHEKNYEKYVNGKFYRYEDKLGFNKEDV